MPALRNIRQERFAQALVLGLAPREAYERAGYTSGARAAAAAARLQNSAALKARITELTSRNATAGKGRTGMQNAARFAGATQALASGKTASARAASASRPPTSTSPHAVPAKSRRTDTAADIVASAEMASNGTTSNGSRSNGGGTNGATPGKPAQNGAAPASDAPNAPTKAAARGATSTPPAEATSDTYPVAEAPSEAAPPASVASLIAEFEEARQLALEVKQPAAAVSATMSKARISGFLGERADAKPGDGPLEMSDLEMARRMALLLARGLRDLSGEAPH